MKKRTRFLFLFLPLAAVILFAMPGCKSGPKDDDIQAGITQKLQLMPDMTGITTAVIDGAVTIKGEYQSEDQKSKTEAAIKEINGVKSVDDQATVAPPPPPAPVVTIAPDDALTKMVMDATKDFSGVKATIADGVITLNGEIKKTDLPKLMMTLNSMKPKKIQNNLVIK
ncbi:MAG: BON domain-containing protein [Bacteroidota bacterium]